MLAGRAGSGLYDTGRDASVAAAVVAAANAPGKLQHPPLLPGSKPAPRCGADVLLRYSIIHHLFVPLEGGARCTAGGVVD